MSSISLSAQETQTLFGGDADLRFAWGLDFKVNSIQDKTGTLAGIYAGVLVDRSVIVAATVGSNIGHPTVNYSYFGLLGQYTHQPHSIVHFCGQVVVAAGATKDYERPKTSLMDNFGNTSGPGFWLVEPGLLAEVNLSEKVRLAGGFGYRFATGLDSGDSLVVRTRVTDADLSGLNLLISLKVALYD
jgi:hypothetical protein